MWHRLLGWVASVSALTSVSSFLLILEDDVDNQPALIVGVVLAVVALVSAFLWWFTRPDDTDLIERPSAGGPVGHNQLVSGRDSLNNSTTVIQNFYGTVNLSQVVRGHEDTPNLRLSGDQPAASGSVSATIMGVAAEATAEAHPGRVITGKIASRLPALSASARGEVTSPPVENLVRIADEARADWIVEGRVFEDCIILGPAVLLPFGVNEITGGLIEGDPEAIFWESDQPGRGLTGAVVIKNCTFKNCRFVRIGFVGESGSLEKLRAIPVVTPPPDPDKSGDQP